MDVLEGKRWVMENLEDGVICPCCNQFAKIYKRKLNSGMAITLIRIYNGVGVDWIHVKDFLRSNKFSNSHDWTLLRYWGILQAKYAEQCDQKNNGYWRITQKGIDFIEKRVTVLSHVRLYDSNLLNLTGEQVTISDCLGSKFSYNELMGEAKVVKVGQQEIF